jgi:hypothetical protein
MLPIEDDDDDDDCSSAAEVAEEEEEAEEEVVAEGFLPDKVMRASLAWAHALKAFVAFRQ